MASKTTLKPIKLEYRPVGSLDSVQYTAVMGLLNDLAIAQAAPDEAPIDAEFYDSPWDIVYTGKPVVFSFTLVNYALSDLPALFGGTYTAADATKPETYTAPSAAFTSEHEWKLTYQKGNTAIVIYRGKTLGVVKQDNKAALGYSVTITSLIADGGTSDPADDKLYAIIGDPKTV